MAFTEEVSLWGWALKSSVLETLLQMGSQTWGGCVESELRGDCDCLLLLKQEAPIAWDVLIYPARTVLQPAFTT